MANRWNLVVVSVLGVLLVAAVALKDPFEGNWKVNVTPDAAGRAFNDTLTFKGGQMHAAELMKQGWKSETVEEDVRRGGVAQFTVILKHPTQGQMRWTGTITASEIRGNVIWTDAQGEQMPYSYSGTKL